MGRAGGGGGRAAGGGGGRSSGGRSGGSHRAASLDAAPDDPADGLLEKYGGGGLGVDAAMAALKAEMGIQ